MSATKRYIEKEIERISKASGYSQNTLMDAFTEIILIDDDVDLKTLERMAMQKHPLLKRMDMRNRGLSAI